MKPSKPREIVETFSQTSGMMYFDSVLDKTAFDHFTTGKVDKDVTVKRFIETTALKERDDLIRELLGSLENIDDEPDAWSVVDRAMKKARDKMEGWK